MRFLSIIYGFSKNPSPYWNSWDFAHPYNKVGGAQGIDSVARLDLEIVTLF